MTEDIKIKKVPKLSWQEKYKSKVLSSDDALRVVKSGDKVVIQPGCAAPMELIRALVRKKDDLMDVLLYHILIVGDLPYLQPGMEKHFQHKAFFIGGNARKSVNEGRAEYIPIFLSEVTLLFKRGIIVPDVALINVSPPDEHGYCSYGIDVGNIKTPTEKSKVIIAQINHEMPRGLGNSFIHLNKIDFNLITIKL